MSVTVIIPSTCESSRRLLLRRAILSLGDQIPDGGCILVVANGDRVDESIIQMIQGFPDTVVERLEEANVAMAQKIGRSLVATEFFCFLDDDDEYLSSALELRLNELRADASADVVVTNGFVRVGNVDRIAVEHPERAQNDPLRALLRENWLASCAGCFRTRTVTPDFFDGRTRFLEWTLLAYKLASSRAIRFIDVPTYRIHRSADSTSTSRAYREAVPAVLEEIVALDLPRDVRRGVREKIGHAEHSLSTYFLCEGDWRRAVRHHVKSLGSYGGLRFLPYSCKLFRFR